MKPITVTATTAAAPDAARARFTDPVFITRWNFASNDWECPEATSDLREGGRFSYRMAARDGSMAFDYAGTWQVVEASRLVQRLDDGRAVEVTFEAVDSGTRVTLVFESDQNAPSEVQFAGWQAILHRFADVAGDQFPIAVTQIDAQPLVGIRSEVPVTELGSFFAEVLPRVAEWLEDQEITPVSAPMAMWCSMDMESGVADCHAGFLVADGAGVAEAVDAQGEMAVGSTIGGDALTVTHQGPYDTVGRSWMALYRRAEDMGKTPGAGWELYVNDPTTVEPQDILTEIYLPIS